MRTMCSREIFTKKCWQQQILDSDLKGAWHYNHVTFTPIAQNFMLYCRLIYMLSILCVILTIKVKVGIPESFKVRWYPRKKTGSSHLKTQSIQGVRPISPKGGHLLCTIYRVVYSRKRSSAAGILSSTPSLTFSRSRAPPAHLPLG